MSESLRDVLVELLDALEDVEQIRERALAILAKAHDNDPFIPRIVREVAALRDSIDVALTDESHGAYHDRAEWREQPL